MSRRPGRAGDRESLFKDRILGKALADYSYKLHHKRKLHIRRHERQQITGLVVNQRLQLPRETRRWLRAVRHRRAAHTLNRGTKCLTVDAVQTAR